jgi:hypothetical protein
MPVLDLEDNAVGALSDGENSDTLAGMPTLRKPKISRQGKLYQDRRAAGLCVDCGAPARTKPDGSPASQCKDCAKVERDRKRKDTGSHPRARNGRGRPIIA